MPSQRGHSHLSDGSRESQPRMSRRRLDTTWSGRSGRHHNKRLYIRGLLASN